MTIALQSRPSPVHLFLCVVIAGVVIRICMTVGTVAVSDSVATGALGRLASLPAGDHFGRERPSLRGEACTCRRYPVPIQGV